MKNIICSIFFLLLNGVAITAQNWVTTVNNNANLPYNPKDSEKPNDYDNENRYFFDDKYHEGELWTTKGHFTTEMQYRFDQLESTIQVKLADGKEMLIDENTVLMFHLFIKDKNEVKKIVFVQETLSENNKKALLQVLYYGTHFQLLRDSRKDLKIKREKPTSFNSDLYYGVENDFKYYILQGSNKIMKEISLTEESLTSIFPTKQARIKQFFKSNDSKKELTLTKLLQLMSKLDEEK